MTVEELIRALQKFPKDAEVLVAIEGDREVTSEVSFDEDQPEGECVYLNIWS